MKCAENYIRIEIGDKFVVCPAEGQERARVVPRAHKDSLSLYPAERQERNTLVM